ncbi:hypothetical protein RZS08_62140, partial [Arthrospira platensis SPKY1]|nr:hypothetical protein [Arthrospira platensis SPKY1]
AVRPVPAFDQLHPLLAVREDAGRQGATQHRGLRARRLRRNPPRIDVTPRQLDDVLTIARANLQFPISPVGWRCERNRRRSSIHLADLKQPDRAHRALGRV